MMDTLVELGTVSRPHGYRGHFVVRTDSGRDSALAYLKEIYIGDSHDDARPVHVVESAWMPKGWKLQVEEIASQAQAEALRGSSLFARREDLAPLEEGEYYVDDLVGSRIVDSRSESEVGTLSGIEFAPAEGIGCDRWWVNTPNGQISIPAHRRYLVRVEPEKRQVWVANWDELK